MSYKIVALVLDHGPAKPIEALLLLSIAESANDAGYAWPGNPTLGAALSANGTQRAVCLRNAGGASVTSPTMNPCTLLTLVRSCIHDGAPIREDDLSVFLPEIDAALEEVRQAARLRYEDEREAQ